MCTQCSSVWKNAKTLTRTAQREKNSLQTGSVPTFVDSYLLVLISDHSTICTIYILYTSMQYEQTKLILYYAC